MATIRAAIDTAGYVNRRTTSIPCGFAPGKSTPATLRADDPRLPTFTARLNLNSATAYAVLSRPVGAKRCLAEARDG